MNRITLHLQISALRVWDFSARGVAPRIERRTNLQPSACRGAAEQVDDDFVADQRFAPPILRDVGEHPVLDLSPYTGARWQMTNRDTPPQLIGQPLQLALPQPCTRTVAASAIGNHQQVARLWVSTRTHLAPPLPQGLDGECRGIVVGPDADPARIGGHIIDPI